MTVRLVEYSLFRWKVTLENGGRVQRRETLTLGLAVAVTPEVLGRVLSDAAGEAMEFTQRAGLSAVGQGTLEHLELVVSDLSRGHPNDPPAERFVVARAYRSRVNELIRGRHTLKELQELYVYAAWLSELLAWLAHDLGNSRTAQAYAASAYVWLRDFETARIHGEAALAAIESASPGSRQQRQFFARLILATALVGLGTPDDAVALGSQALPSTRVVTSGMVAHARDLDRALVSRYPRLACAREFHEQYRHVAQRSTASAGRA